MTQIMFEVFNVPCLYVQNSAVLALYAGGRTTGVVLDSGYGITHSVPIFEGYAIPSGIERINISGEHLTQEMQKLVNARTTGQNMIGGMNANAVKKTFTTPAEVSQLRQMKESMTYCVENFEQAMQESNESKACEKPYHLPDGSKIILGKERFCCPEIMFNPALAERSDIDTESIQKHIYDSVMKCDESIRRDFFKHIVLAGGNTLFTNISNRLWREMNQLVPHNIRCKIIENDERKYSAWLGGSIHATLSTFHTMWITK